MAEKPILFNATSINGILKGIKTQTRRVVKPQPQFFGDTVHYGRGNYYIAPRDSFPDCILSDCPYGQVGDTFRVRETWACIGAEHIKPSEIAPGYPVQYRADGKSLRVEKWRPSIFMPKWASRMRLLITRIRAEWLQDISQTDARAEGIVIYPAAYRGAPQSFIDQQYIPNFKSLWNSINGKRGYDWDANPLVWVVDFECIEPPVAASK